MRGENIVFYEQFSDLCAQHNIKETTLARQLGIGASAPKRWKEGSTPDLVNAKKIADYFGVSIDYLMAGSSSAPYNQIGDVSGSAIVQGVNGGSVSVSNGSGQTELTAAEAELLRIFRSLDVRGQNAVMSCLYEQEDRINQK